MSRAELELLRELLETPTVSPLESGVPPLLARAQRLYAAYAATLGFDVVHDAPPPREVLDRPDVPSVVTRAAAALGDDFLASQPNVVLRLGPARPVHSTVCFNAHLDTVGGSPPVQVLEDRVTGRGAVDMKGPAVALLAGVRRALELRPELPGRSSVLVHAVGGEEGGAMGTYGTRVVVEAGYVGRLNVFAEPTDGHFIDSSPATMTAEVRVAGIGATDDEPESGENASLLLGSIACNLAADLDEPVRRAGGKLCIAGLHTGRMHNRVYGEGSLLVNVSYPTSAAGRHLSERLAAAVDAAVASFGERFAGIAVAERAAGRAAEICRLEWLKRGLPTLDNRDEEWEGRLHDAGIPRLPDHGALRPFTCDAIWGGLPGSYTIVFGPGNLGRNGAHTEDEHVLLADLHAYSSAVARIVLAFDDAVAEGRGGE